MRININQILFGKYSSYQHRQTNLACSSKVQKNSNTLFNTTTSAHCRTSGWLQMSSLITLTREDNPYFEMSLAWRSLKYELISTPIICCARERACAYTCDMCAYIIHSKALQIQLWLFSTMHDVLNYLVSTDINTADSLQWNRHVHVCYHNFAWMLLSENQTPHKHGHHTWAHRCPCQFTATLPGNVNLLLYSIIASLHHWHNMYILIVCIVSERWAIYIGSSERGV